MSLTKTQITECHDKIQQILDSACETRKDVQLAKKLGRDITLMSRLFCYRLR